MESRKPCLICKATKPLHWFAYGGWDDVCTICRDLEAVGELVPAPPSSEFKTCTGCSLLLARLEFGSDKHTKDGLCTRCKQCRREETEGARVRRSYRRYVMESRKRNGQTGDSE